jgi:cysteine desulfurase
MQFFKHFLGTDRIYLDYASSTPVDRGMVRAFPQIPHRVLGANPSALHKEGVELKEHLKNARALVAETLDARPEEIIFTSGATESDNLAIAGAVRAWLESGLKPDEIAVFVSDIEHAAVKEVAAMLAREGIRDGMLPTEEGVVNPKTIVVPENVKALLVSVMYVNNEIGTVQPIKEIAKRVRYLRKQYPDVSILFHVDATQAPLFYSLNTSKLGVDLMTLGATKLYCPKGVGILFKKRGTALAPLEYGGGQEFGLRPGTEAVQLIHYFTYALWFAQARHESHRDEIADIQNFFEMKVTKMLPRAIITAETKERAPHISHIAIPGLDSELLVLELDAKGIAVSAKSACKNEENTESPIVESMYGAGVGAIRFSFGRRTTKGEITRAVKALRRVVKKYKK